METYFSGTLTSGRLTCEGIFSGAAIVCDPLSAKASNLAGWNVAVEKKYLRYFGVVADFSGQYGSASQTNFLFGLRGGPKTRTGIFKSTASAGMQSGVACGAEGNKILFRVVAGLAAKFLVVNFKIRHCTTGLASPAIPP